MKCRMIKYERVLLRGREKNNFNTLEGRTYIEIASARDCRNNYSKKKRVVLLQTRLEAIKNPRVRCSLSPPQRLPLGIPIKIK